MPEPEALARIDIDDLLVEAGWVVQDRDELNLHAGPGIAIREVSIPIPTLIVQREIIDTIERMFSVIHQLESTIESGAYRSEVLRQSILRIAFSARLV